MKKNISNKKENRPKTIVPEKETPAWMFFAGCFMVALPVIFFIMAPCLKNGFSNWDDPTYLENNPLITSISFEHIKKIFTEIYFSNYQPLHIFSYMIEYSFFKLNPFGYHLVSMLMHAAITVVVMWFAYLFSGKKFIAVVTGILFAVHPMHVESVAWASERKDLLYALFFFTAMIFYLHYIKNTNSKTNLAWCFIFFVLAIFSKAMAASLPPVLVLTDIYYKRKVNARLIMEKIPFFLLATVMGLISVYASGKDGSIDTNKTYSFFDRVILANANLLEYVLKLIAPVHLSAYYPYPDKVNGWLPYYYYFFPFIIAILVAAVIFSLKKTRFIFYCAGFITLTVFLVLQLLPVGPTVFSERYSYIPSAAFFMLIAWTMDYFISRHKNKPSLKYVFFTALGMYSIWLGITTNERCKVWHDPVSFWTDVISKFNNVPIAYNNRGHYLNKTGKKEEALADFNTAISMNADYDMAHFNRGSLYGEMGKLNESLADLNKAISLNGKLSEAYKMRGQVYAITGKKDEALNDFKKALELNPGFSEIYFNIGVLYFNAGNRDEACKNFNKAVEMHYDKALEMVNKYCSKN